MTTPENRLVARRDNGGRFVQGVTGNPGGRPRGLASYIREQTDDGEALVDKVWSILQHPKGKGIAAQKLQLDCIEWLADRGWGKAVQNVEHSGAIIHAWDVLKDMSDADLEAIVQASRALNEAKANVIEGEGRVLEE